MFPYLLLKMKHKGMPTYSERKKIKLKEKGEEKRRKKKK